MALPTKRTKCIPHMFLKPARLEPLVSYQAETPPPQYQSEQRCNNKLIEMAVGLWGWNCLSRHVARCCCLCPIYCVRMDRFLKKVWKREETLGKKILNIPRCQCMGMTPVMKTVYFTFKLPMACVGNIFLCTPLEMSFLLLLVLWRHKSSQGIDNAIPSQEEPVRYQISIWINWIIVKIFERKSTAFFELCATSLDLCVFVHAFGPF